MTGAKPLQVHADIEECAPNVWFGDHDAKRVDLLTEQLLGQREGFAMLLLHAQLADDDDDGEAEDAGLRPWR